MGDIQAGDQVFDKDGATCTVTAVTPLMWGRKCYRVKFDDGASVIADAEHLWLTQDRKQRKNSERRVDAPNPRWATRPQCVPTSDWSVRTTAEMLEDYIVNGNILNYSIGLQGESQYPEVELPIPPYTLGAWLGDGHSSSATLTSMDPEILQNIEAEGISIGKGKNGNSGKAKAYRLGSKVYGRWDDERREEAVRMYNEGNYVIDIAKALGTGRRHVRQALQEAGIQIKQKRTQRVWLRKRSSNGTFLPNQPKEARAISLQETLRQEGLLNNKHIPAIYMTASSEQRMALLQGLMDTDGYCDQRQGRCVFTNSNEGIAKDVLELCRSLGIKARIHSKIATLYGVSHSRSWRIEFTTNKPVFKLSRKLNRISKRLDGQCKRRFIKSITLIKSVPVKCIEVDAPSHTYLCGKDYLISHNTSFGPWWLWREMQAKGPGDYLVAAPTFKLLERAAVPYLEDAFSTKLELGKLVGGAYGMFRISPKGEMKLFGKRTKTTPTRILFGHADNPESLEAAQYKAAWLDEPGQSGFKQASWEAIQRRLAIDQGRALLTTTPYFSGGWLKDQVYDRWKRAKFCQENNLPVSQWDEEFDVINFESIDNPSFPLSEWDRLREAMPPWKFNLFCRGIFTRPVGAVFDCWDKDTMTDVAEFIPPPEWPRYVGIDFGYPNFAAIFICEEMVDVADLPNTGTIQVTIKTSNQVDGSGNLQPAMIQKHQSKLISTGRYRVYKEYRPDNAMHAKEHVKGMIRGEPRLPEYVVGGAPGETAWRDQFSSCGYPINEPDQSEREVGIDRVYAMIAENRLIVHKSCSKLIDELDNMSRIVGDNGAVMDDIDDEGAYHSIAALRYICSWLRRASQKVDIYF